ncbi:choline-phosphate cytidylyltransferase [Malassezia sp. CBS 17886]|nr:choline-phosphate cytidylyltransferase [Malassezia sp. CBS 17886]
MNSSAMHTAQALPHAQNGGRDGAERRFVSSSRDASEVGTARLRVLTRQEDNDQLDPPRNEEPPVPFPTLAHATPRTRGGTAPGGRAHGRMRERDIAAAASYDGDVEYATSATGDADADARPSDTDTYLHVRAEVPSRSYFDVMGTERTEPRGPPLAPVPSVESIREWVHAAVFAPDTHRPYRINPPPRDRPVRIYADGVYDLFHYAHALQLRQAKLSFPNVYLIVGVVSSALTEKHKNRPMLGSAERGEALKNCRWVDEVLEDAPWVIQPDLVRRLQIDYVAHDELPYALTSSGSSHGSGDLYDWLKGAGKFLPTRRTDGISTSDLMKRIVSMYRDGVLDGKLEKMGDEELSSRHSSDA